MPVNEIASDRRTPVPLPYIRIDHAVVDHAELEPLAGWLYVVLTRFLQEQKNSDMPAIKDLAAASRMSQSSVKKYLKVLENKRLIQVTRTFKKSGAPDTNHYALVDFRPVPVGEGGRSSENLPSSENAESAKTTPKPSSENPSVPETGGSSENPPPQTEPFTGGGIGGGLLVTTGTNGSNSSSGDSLETTLTDSSKP